MSSCLLILQGRGWQGLQGSQGTRGKVQGQVVKVKVIIKVRIRVPVYSWSMSANFLNPPVDSANIQLHIWIATRLISTVEVPNIALVSGKECFLSEV